MDAKKLEKMLQDTTASDRDVAKAMLKFLNTSEGKHRKQKTWPTEEEMRELNRLSGLSHSLRPEAMELLRKKLTKQHEKCCGAKSCKNNK